MPDDALPQPTFPPRDEGGPTITALLDRTTPGEILPLDLDALARRSRGRQRRHRAALTASVAAVVVLFAGAVISLRSAEEGSRPVHSADPGDAFDEVPPLTYGEPLGSWRELPRPPFSPRFRASGGALSDGRALVWGGSAGEEANASEDNLALDGGIYDPATGQWTSIPAAPLPMPGDRAVSGYLAALTDDRLAVVGHSSADTTVAAVFDVATGEWDASPPLEGPSTGEGNEIVWDGETLVVVRFGPETGDPTTLRWEPGSDEWTTGNAPPFSARRYVGAAFDGERLALWGGSAASRAGVAPPSDGDESSRDLGVDRVDPGARANGAIYDVASDTWQDIPQGPLSPRGSATVAWSDGRLLVGGGTDTLLDPTADLESVNTLPPDFAAYVPDSGTWESLDPYPDGGIGTSPDRWLQPMTSTSPILVVGPRGNYDPSKPVWFLADGGWEGTPEENLHRLDDGVVVALSDGADQMTGGRLTAFVRTSDGTWHDGVESPINRSAATLIPLGDQVLVVGGYTHGSVEDQAPVQGDAWVFDLSRD